MTTEHKVTEEEFEVVDDLDEWEKFLESVFEEGVKLFFHHSVLYKLIDGKWHPDPPLEVLEAMREYYALNPT